MVVVGDAGHVFGAGGDFATAGAAEVGGLDEAESEGGECEEAREEHFCGMWFAAMG